MLKVVLVRSRAIDPAINKVAKALSKNGYDVKLLVWDRMGNKQTENIDGYTICRFGLKAPYDKISAALYLPIWWLYEFFFLLKQNPTVIHACDLDTLIPAIFARFIKKTKLCYTIYDFYADNLPTIFPQAFRKFIAFVEKFGIQFVEFLFLVDESRFEQVRGAKIQNLAYIYNSPPDYFSSGKKYYSKFGDNLIIFYAGLIHNSRGLRYIISAIKDLNDVKLVIAGTVSDPEFLNILSTSINTNIQYIGHIPYEIVIKRTVESDLLFAFYDPVIPNNRYASPNKLFEAMMCQKPILVSDGGTMAEIVREENCGIVVPYGDVDAIKHAILTLKNEPTLCKRFSENGRKAYDTKYSWEIMEKRLLEIYRRLDPEKMETGQS